MKKMFSWMISPWRKLSRKLNTEIVIVDEGGADLVSAVLDPPTQKKQKRRQMYEQTGSSNCGQA